MCITLSINKLENWYCQKFGPFFEQEYQGWHKNIMLLAITMTMMMMVLVDNDIDDNGDNLRLPSSAALSIFHVVTVPSSSQLPAQDNATLRGNKKSNFASWQKYIWRGRDKSLLVWRTVSSLAGAALRLKRTFPLEVPFHPTPAKRHQSFNVLTKY